MIKLETKFSSTIVVQETLLPNTWFVDIRLLANSSVNQKNYNIALDRIEFYVNEILDNSILLSPSASEMFNNPIGLNGRVHTNLQMVTWILLENYLPTMMSANTSTIGMKVMYHTLN